MKRIAIDFAPRGWRGELARAGWRWQWMTCALLVAALAAGAAATVAEAESERRRAAAQAASAAVAARAAPRIAAEAATRIDRGLALAVNAVVMQLNVPWDEILDAVERATPRRIALLSLAPDPGRQLLAISAEAPGVDGMLNYVSRLRDSGFFNTVALVSQDVVDDNGTEVIRFELEAGWQEAGR